MPNNPFNLPLSITHKLGEPLIPQTMQTAQGSMPFSKQTEGKINPQDALLNPGSTFLTPGLKKMGIGGPIPMIAGLAADVLAPGPGELGNVRGIGKLVTKQIDNLTKNELIRAIDYVRLKQPFSQVIEDSIGLLAQKFGITGKRLGVIVNHFEDLVAKTKTKDVSGRVPLFKMTKLK